MTTRTRVGCGRHGTSEWPRAPDGFLNGAQSAGNSNVNERVWRSVSGRDDVVHDQRGSRESCPWTSPHERRQRRARHANIRSYMTSDGSPYSRLQRAIRSGNLPLIHATAAELGWVPLRDALAILLVIDAKDEERFGPCRSSIGRSLRVGGQGSQTRGVSRRPGLSPCAAGRKRSTISGGPHGTSGPSARNRAVAYGVAAIATATAPWVHLVAVRSHPRDRRSRGSRIWCDYARSRPSARTSSCRSLMVLGSTRSGRDGESPIAGARVSSANSWRRL